MNGFIEKWVKSSLIFKIIIGLIIGTILGLLIPQFKILGIIGEAFVSALKAIAPLLVFVLVSSALSRAVEGIGDRFKTVIILYISSTFLAAMIAVAGSALFPLKLTLAHASSVKPPGGFNEIITNMVMSIFTNPLYSLSQGDYLGILFWAIVFGISLKLLEATLQKMFFQTLQRHLHWL